MKISFFFVKFITILKYSMSLSSFSNKIIGRSCLEIGLTGYNNVITIALVFNEGTYRLYRYGQNYCGISFSQFGLLCV